MALPTMETVAVSSGVAEMMETLSPSDLGDPDLESSDDLLILTDGHTLMSASGDDLAPATPSASDVIGESPSQGDASASSDVTTVSHKERGVLTKKTETDSDYDTDLEVEDEETQYDVCGTKIYMEACRTLGVVPVSFFARHTKQERLVMRHHGLGPLGARALAIPLVSNTSILILDLEDNWLGGEGARQLAEMLKDNCFITSLSLADNRIGTVGAKALCDTLQLNASLTHLNLSGSEFQDKDADLFATIILENNVLRELNLSHNQFGAEGDGVLGHAIGENETLESLDISWNQFRGKSAIELIEGIKVNSRLKRVNLAWNGLGNEAMGCMSECLKHNHVITKLDISSNRITQEGASVLCRGLDCSETLRVLKITGNPMNHMGAMFFIHAINNERSVLEQLDMRSIWVSKDFEKIYTDIKESRTVDVQHAGVLENFKFKPIVKKPASGSRQDAAEAAEAAARLALETFLKTDPLVRLQNHLRSHNLRLVDFFRQIDHDGDYKLTLDALQRGLEQAGLSLNDHQLHLLIAKLDPNSRDGIVDYSSLVGARTDTIRRTRRLSRVLLDTLSPRHGEAGSRELLQSILKNTSSSGGATPR